jgi:hypothetical protein
MPQLKVGHLRAIPHLSNPEDRLALDAFGRGLSQRNTGITGEERTRLDTLVDDALGLDAKERELVRNWAAANPPPTPRSKRTD